MRLPERKGWSRFDDDGDEWNVLSDSWQHSVEFRHHYHRETDSATDVWVVEGRDNKWWLLQMDDSKYSIFGPYDDREVALVLGEML